MMSNLTLGDIRRSSSDDHITKQEFQREISHYTTKEDSAKLETQIAQAETRLIKWMTAFMAGSVALATAIATLIERLT